jgi:hypothetical protein
MDDKPDPGPTELPDSRLMAKRVQRWFEYLTSPEFEQEVAEMSDEELMQLMALLKRYEAMAKAVLGRRIEGKGH